MRISWIKSLLHGKSIKERKPQTLKISNVIRCHGCGTDEPINEEVDRLLSRVMAFNLQLNYWCQECSQIMSKKIQSRMDNILRK